MDYFEYVEAMKNAELAGATFPNPNLLQRSSSSAFRNKKSPKYKSVNELTDEQREKRRKLLRVQQRRRIECESEEQRRRRLAKLRANRERRLKDETEEQRKTRLLERSLYQKRRILNETPEQRESRLMRLREYQQKRIMNETEEERRARLDKMRMRNKKVLEMKKDSEDGYSGLIGHNVD